MYIDLELFAMLYFRLSGTKLVNISGLSLEILRGPQLMFPL